MAEVKDEVVGEVKAEETPKTETKTEAKPEKVLISKVLKDFLDEEETAKRIYKNIVIDKSYGQMNFVLNDRIFSYKCDYGYNHNHASFQIAKMILKAYGATKEEIESRDVDAIKRVATKIKNWNAAGCLLHFLPDSAAIRVLDCNDEGEFTIALFNGDEQTEFTATHTSIPTARHLLAAKVMSDKDRFHALFTKWLRSKKTLDIKFTKPEQFSKQQMKMINFYKTHHTNQKGNRSSIWKNQLVELPNEDENVKEESKKYMAAFYIRHIGTDKNDAAQKCLKSIKNICQTEQMKKMQGRNNRVQGSQPWGGQWNQPQQWGPGMMQPNPMMMGNPMMGGMNMGGMMSPAQYTMMYQQQMMMQSGMNMGGFRGGNNFRGGNFRGGRGGNRGRGRGRGGKRGGGKTGNNDAKKPKTEPAVEKPTGPVDFSKDDDMNTS